MEVDRHDPEVTFLTTRCCGADTGTPHWVGCRQRLDVNDPASYRNAMPDACFFCDRDVSELPARRVIIEGHVELICDICWEKAE